ncbi:MAG: YaiO family outer membrane beta-barrel protein [Brevundimonas sp.]|nr:YaiO family outer membrane beta-barrel protein [Brevundimonas sp.]
MIVQDVPAEVREDPSALYAAALSDRRAGRAAAAEARLRRVLQIRPDDVDARLLLGLSLIDLERLDEAEDELLRVVEAAPNYVDAQIGLARISQRRGDRHGFAMRAAEAVRLAPERADVRDLVQSKRDVPRWRLDVDVERSRLGAGLSDWNETRLSATHLANAPWSFAASVERTDRFDRVDIFTELRIARSFAGGEGWIAVGGAAEADHRAELSLRAGGVWTVAPAITATLEGSIARFPAGEVKSLQPGLGVDLFGGRASVSGRWINLWDERGDRVDGYAVSARWAVSDRFRLRLDHADAPETSEGVVADVSSVALSGEWDLTERLSLRAGLVDEQRTFYDRQAVSVGVGWRFW